MKKEDIKKFVKDHKTEIIVGGLSVAAFVCAAIASHDNESSAESSAVNEVLDRVSNNHSGIDEDIFTDLAPQIENLVLTKECDNGYIERTYHVEWPVCRIDEAGGYHESICEGKKKVTVCITDVTNRQA